MFLSCPLPLDTSVEQMESSLEKGTKEMIAAKAEINKIEEQKERIQKDSFLTSEEVQAELEALNKAEAHYKEQIVNGKKYEERTIQALTDIKQEGAKQSPMVDAANEADAVLDAAGKEVIGMLFDEAKDHMDAENDKKQAEAEEKAEQEKKLEERIEAMKAEKEEKKDSETPAVEQLEKSTRRMVKIAETGEAVQKELKAVVDRLKLDLEDLKGIEVDEGV